MRQFLPIVVTFWISFFHSVLWPEPAPAPQAPNVPVSETQKKPVPIAPKPDEPTPLKWSGSVEGSFINTIGQVDNVNTQLKSNIYGENKTLKLYGGMLYLRGKNNDVLSSFQRRAEVKADRKLTADFYGYLQYVCLSNEIVKLDMGNRVSGGLGYHFFKTAKIKESVDIGASYNSEDYSSIVLRARTYSYQASNVFYWKITNGLELNHRYEYLPRQNDFKKFRSRSDASFKVYIGKHLYSNFGIINEYDSAPASVTTAKHKSTVLISIGLKL